MMVGVDFVADRLQLGAGGFFEIFQTILHHIHLRLGALADAVFQQRVRAGAGTFAMRQKEQLAGGNFVAVDRIGNGPQINLLAKAMHGVELFHRAHADVILAVFGLDGGGQLRRAEQHGT